MNDVLDRLDRLGPLDNPRADDATVAADVRRGRRALTRRYARRGATVGACLVVGTLGGVALTHHDSPARPPSATPATHPATTPSTHTGAIRLVRYDGKQLPGFTVTKVPEGFVLQGADAYSLDIARAGDTSDIGDFRNKIVVSIQADAPASPPGKDVTVAGHPGIIRDTTDGGARVLQYQDGSNTVVVQMWEGIGLTDDQLVAFADGITVTASAQALHG